MTTTTINTIKASLETVVAKLAPTGSKLGRRVFQRASTPPSTWEKKAKADIDREFAIVDWKRGKPIGFGNLSQYDYVGSFDVVIGHTKSGDQDAGSDRRDTDLSMIAMRLERPANLPAGVWSIRLDGQSTKEQDEFWISTLSFKITYALDAQYGA